jgi:hypothetical protein
MARQIIKAHKRKPKPKLPPNPRAAYFKNFRNTPEFEEKYRERLAWWRVPANRLKAKAFVENLMVEGAQHGEIKRKLNETFTVGANRAEKLMQKIREEWALEDAANRKHLRAAHTRRLLSHIRAAKADGNWSAVFSGERILGQVTGTIVPQEIHIQVDRVDLVQQVLGSLDDTRLKELYDRQLAREKQLESAGLSMSVVRGGDIIDIDPLQVQREVEMSLVERVEDGGE